MTLPNAVARQSEAADAAILALAAAANTAPEATPAIATAPEAGTPSGETPPTPAVSSEQHQGNDSWEHKFHVLQGKFNAEVPRLNQQIRDLRDQLQQAQAAQVASDPAELQQLRDEIGTLKQQLLSAQQAQQSQPVHAPQLDSLRSEYGADLVDGLVAHVQQLVKPVQQKLDSLDQTTRQTAQETAVDKMRRTLRELPSPIDFDRMNRDPGFLAWLAEVETFSGSPRQQLLQSAFSKGDYPRAALFFSEYANANRQTESRANPAAPDLSKHVTVGSEAPLDGNRGTQPVEVWTQDRIKKLYEDERTGRMPRAEFERLEREMFAAINAAQR